MASGIRNILFGERMKHTDLIAAEIAGTSSMLGFPAETGVQVARLARITPFASLLTAVGDAYTCAAE